MAVYSSFSSSTTMAVYSSFSPSSYGEKIEDRDSSFSPSSNGEKIEDREGGYLSFYVPPGHRFVPTDCELVEHYLLNKILRRQLPCNVIKYVDSLHKYDPEQLPISKFTHGRKNEAYFFTHANCSYSPGAELIMHTTNGYWKGCNGADDVICCGNQIIGFKKTYVFHQKREPEGEKGCWMLYEYRVNPNIILPPEFNDIIRAERSCVICRVQYKKSNALEDSGFDGED